MSLLQEKLINLTRQLIQTISGLQVDSSEYQNLEKVVLSKLQHADTAYLPSRKEIDRTIQSLSDKFRFHGFPKQAKDLQRIYDKLSFESGDGDNSHLSVIKLLISLSESPTNNFHKIIESNDERHEEEAIDWPKYLLEGITRWTPPPDVDTSDSDSENFAESEREEIDSSPNTQYVKLPLVQTESTSSLTYHEAKAKLEDNVQSYWFNRRQFAFKPPSGDPVANVAFLWDNYVEDITKGIIPNETATVISEYKVLREIIWQFYGPHQSACFGFIGNKFVPRKNVTIASVRPQVFERFIQEFVVYIESLQGFRDFSGLVNPGISRNSPDTYLSYDAGIQTILSPVFEFLREIENKIKLQESTFTLLSLAGELKPFFQLVKVLCKVHKNAMFVHKHYEGLQTSRVTSLLSNLYQGLFLSSSKLEQDIYLTLYLHSLYKYFTIINNWLESDVLSDPKDEFVIIDANPKDPYRIHNLGNVNECSHIQQGESDWHLQFLPKELKGVAKSDPILNLINTHVLEFGKSFHLLRVLQQRHMFTKPIVPYKENLYEAFKRRVLEKIAHYFNSEINVDLGENENLEEPDYPDFKFPIGCPDDCRYATEMDKLENLVDTSDGFLIKAFESYFVNKAKLAELDQQSLFVRIEKLTKGLFPTQNIIPHAFIEILEERYGKLGIMVKNAFVEDCELEKHFLFLQNVFLFKDDMIFSFYHRFFKLLDFNCSWRIQLSLTSHLQDTIADAYPKLYDKASVDLNENWQLNPDPVIVCRKINIQYRIEWPINIVIRTEHIKKYKYLFQFILKIKWALYTLNLLCFNDLQPNKSTAPVSKAMKRLMRKLEILRFGLVNIFSNIQHYILGHLFSELSLKFKKSFESAHGLDNIIKAHTDFIRNYCKACYNFQEYEKDGYGFCLLLELVKKLKAMWGNVGRVKSNDLDMCEKAYWMCHLKIEPIINPTGLCL